MFRRLPSGLPKDPVFPNTLGGLGYFINEEDEIRNIENPKAYFKYFITKNMRYNEVHRNSMNQAIVDIVHSRLENLDMQKIRLPLGASANEPHIPIFVSNDLQTKERVVVLFYEQNQDLGVFAHRILGGEGGINKGSAVNLVKYIQSQHTSPTNSDAPGIILANLGQLRWWRRGKQAVTPSSWGAIPQKSAVEATLLYDPEKNTIPGNRSSEEHCDYVFNHVIQKFVHHKACINVIGVSEGARVISLFLNDPTNYQKWASRITAFAAVATWFHTDEIQHEGLSKWLRKYARAYLISSEASGICIEGPEGRKGRQAYGCPVFSLGVPYYTEVMLPKGYRLIVDWFQEVANDAEYENPEFHVFDGGEEDEFEEVAWSGEEASTWGQVADDE